MPRQRSQKKKDSMAYYNKEIIDKVKKIDVLSYLSIFEPDNLVKYNRDTYCTKDHDSLKISNGMWYWFSKGIGGVNALDYLMKVNGNTFLEAMDILVSKVNDITPIERKKEYSVPKNIVLPEKNSDNNKAVSYLLSRGIDRKIIDKCIKNNLIYEDKYHNVVFLGYDKNDDVRYAFIRGSNKTRFMKEAYGSHKAFSFRLDSLNEDGELHLFESAIDLLSYATLYPDYEDKNLLSLAGIYQPQKNLEESNMPLVLNYYLNQHPKIKKIYLHLDNDEAGRSATKALLLLLNKNYEVINEPSKYGKDFNDYLLKIKQLNKNDKERWKWKIIV